MQFEDFDKKMREAADNHHPAYDEKAWVKMEKLLDKHLPVEEDRRRILFLVILLCLGLGGTGLFILKPWKTKNEVAVEKPVERKTPSVQDVPTTPEPKTETFALAMEPNVAIITPGKPALRQKTTISKKETTRPSEKQNLVTTNIPPSQIPSEKTTEPILVNKNQPSSDPFSLNSEKDEPKKVGTPIAEAEKAISEPIVKANQPKKVKAKKQHAVFISVSGGPDLSFVKDNAGTVKFSKGAGIGYTYNNRISLRTGFYTGRKIYSAGPEAYNPPPGFYAYYPFLEKVDANCEINEVPISLSYHFGKSSRHNFFASVGVSSYFMKEEKYKYYYKYSQNGPTINKTRTIRDVNKHILAGLTFSAGYNQRITRHISLTAEPYVKLPLEGVGYGKVKLKSAGVSMSLSVNPFAKKPK